MISPENYPHCWLVQQWHPPVVFIVKGAPQGYEHSCLLHLRIFLCILVWLTLRTGQTIACAESEFADVTTLEQKVHDLVNEHRTAMGLAPLNYSEDIALVARRHSRDMARGSVGMGHEGVEERGGTLAKIITYSQFGENVGANSQEPSSTSQTAVAGWLNSSGHRANIEGKFDLTGVGIARSGNTFFFTQIFLTTVGASHPSVEPRRSRNRISEQSYSPTPEPNKPSSRSRGIHSQSYEDEESDPRKRSGRKRVRGGYVQDLDKDH